MSAADWIDRLRSSWQLRDCGVVGPGASVLGEVVVYNGQTITIGARLRVDARGGPIQLGTAGAKSKLTIGDDVFIGQGANLVAALSLVIGDGTRIGPHASVVDTNFHEIASPVDRRPLPTIIGKRVRIGAYAMVMKGSILGDEAIVLPGAVVSGRVEAGTVVGGAPAQVSISIIGRRSRAGTGRVSGASSCPRMSSPRRGASLIPIMPPRSASTARSIAISIRSLC
jgi:acetyltransferase-like isoleucine patch superfamily enzyme